MGVLQIHAELRGSRVSESVRNSRARVIAARVVNQETYK
jgi:hypothetical protein